MSQQVTRAQPSRTLKASPARSLGSDIAASSNESEGPTYDDLYEEARKRGLSGRSKMSKTELERALAL